MTDPSPTESELEDLRTIADYQFGAGAGRALFSPAEELTVRRTRSDRPEQVFADGRRLVTLGVDGRFRISVAGGRRLGDALRHPRHRVVVGEESVPYVRDGRNAFAKFVEEVDSEVRPGDEVLVVHDGDLLGVGRAELAADAMLDFGTGMAVMVRHGAGE